MNLTPVDHDPFEAQVPTLIPVDHDPFAASGGGPLSNAPDEGWLSGAAKGAGTAIIKGAANSPGVFGNISNFANYLVARGESAITGRPYEEVAKEHAARQAAIEAADPLLKYTSPANVLPSGQAIAAPILAKTGEYKPSSELGRMAQTGVETAAGMIGPGAGAVAPETALAQALVKAPLRMAPGNIAAGAVGQGVGDVTGDPLAGAVAGGVLPTIAASVPGRIVGPIARPFAEDIPGIGGQFSGTREQMVAGQLRSAATNPLNVEDRSRREIVPGSQPTLGQLTGDQGILQAERQARTTDNSAFNLREGEQNAARLAALRSVAPADADTMAVSQAFQAHLANIDQATDAAVTNLGSRARDLAAQLGPGATPEATGAAIRNGIETARGEAKAARRALYDAVDPDQTLNLVASPVREEASGIQDKIGQYAEQPAGKEKSILADASALPDVMKFHDLMDFDQRLTAAMSEERRAAGETPAWARMSQLKGSVQSAINNALENQVAFERQSATAGPGMEGRLRSLWNVPPAGADRANAVQPVARVGVGVAGLPGGGTGANLGAPSTRGQAGVGPSAPSGDQGISAQAGGKIKTLPRLPPRPTGPAPTNLQTFIKRAGGVKDEGGDLAASGFRNVDGSSPKGGLSIKGGNGPKLIDKENGLPMDEARRAAAQAGYLGYNPDEAVQNSTVPDFIDRLIDHPAYSIHDDEAVAQREAYKRAVDVREQARANAPEPAQNIAEEAARIAPNVDAVAAQRLAAAKAAHAEYARTYRQAPVGLILKTQGFTGNYALPSSAVQARAFIKGDRGYQTTKSFLDASKNNPDVLAAIQDHALGPLRDSLLPDGTINPKKHAAWQSDYEGSLRAINEASPGFSDRFSSAAKASEELMQAGLYRKAQLDDFQKTDAAKFLGKTDPAEVENQLGLILRDKTKGPTRIRALVKQAGGDQNVLDGLRKAGVDWMTREFSNAAEAPGGTGEKTIASAKFRNFVNDSGAALAELYPKEQVGIFKNVAADLQRADRSVTATAIKGSPGTAKDILPYFQKAMQHAQRHTSLIGAAQAGAVAGFIGGHIPGGIAGAGSAAAAFGLNTLRQAGLSKVDAMFRDALLNPDRAKYYLSKSPQRTEAGSIVALSRAVRRSLTTGQAIQPPG